MKYKNIDVDIVLAKQNDDGLSKLIVSIKVLKSSVNVLVIILPPLCILYNLLLLQVGGKIISANNGKIMEERRYVAPYKIIVSYISTIAKNHDFSNLLNTHKNHY